MSQTVFMALLVLLVVAAAGAVAVYIFASVYATASPRVRRRMRLGVPARRSVGGPLAAFRLALRRRAAAAKPRPTTVLSERHGDDMVTFARGPGGGAWSVIGRERVQAEQRTRWEAREVAASGGGPLLDLAQRHAPGWAAETGPAGGRGLYAGEPEDRTPEEHQGATEGWSPAAEVGLDKKPVTLTHTKLDVEALAVLAAFDAHVQDWRTAPQWLTAYGAEVDAALRAADLEGIATAQARWRQTAFDVPTGEYRRVLATAA